MKKSVLSMLCALSATATPALAAQNYYYNASPADVTMPPSTGLQGIVGITLPKGTWAITANASPFTGGSQTNYIDCFISANKGTLYGRASAAIGVSPGFSQWTNVPVSTVITTSSTQIVALGCNLEYTPNYLTLVKAQGSYISALKVID